MSTTSIPRGTLPATFDELKKLARPLTKQELEALKKPEAFGVAPSGMHVEGTDYCRFGRSASGGWVYCPRDPGTGACGFGPGCVGYEH